MFVFMHRWYTLTTDVSEKWYIYILYIIFVSCQVIVPDIEENILIKTVVVQYSNFTIFNFKRTAILQRWIAMIAIAMRPHSPLTFSQKC